MDRLAALVLRWRWPIIVAYLVVTAIFAARLPEIEIDPEIKNQLSPDMPARQDLRAIEERFGGGEMVMVVVEAPDVLAPATLDRARRIGEALAREDVVARVVSPFTLTDIRGSPDGMMLVEPAIDAVPTDAAGRNELRDRLAANELVFGNVLARDFSALSIIALLSAEASDLHTLAAVERILAENPGPETVRIGGMPNVRVNVSRDIRTDIRLFAPVALSVIVLLLYASLREIRGVVLPFTVMIMTVVFAVGLVPMLGWKFQMITITLPVTILAIGNDHSVHLVARFQEDNLPGTRNSASELAAMGLRGLGVPVIAAGLTTVAGMFCLLTHVVVPAQQLGWLAGLGLGYAMLASLTFVPAVMSLLPVPTPREAHDEHDEDGGGGWLDRALSWNARFVLRWPRAVVGVTLGAAALASTGIARIEVDTNPVNYYPADAEVAQTAALVNRHFGGSTEIAVMIEGDVQDPVVLGRIDALERDLGSMSQVGQTMSIARIVRKMNRAVNGGDPAADRIPETREAIAQLLLLYSMGGSPEDFERLVDFDYQHALVTARINSLSTGDIAAVVDRAQGHVDDFAGLPVVVGGFGKVFADLVDAVVSGQVSSLALSIAIVAALNAACFGSLSAGLWSMVPLLVAVPVLFGLMGFSGIELNVVTAMLSSIMIGVGVDYTTHFMFRYREERLAGLSPEEANYRTLMTSGRGVVFNALAVMVGFAVLLVSSFLPVRFFGFLVVVSIGGCLLAALVLMPPLMLLFRPSFAEPVGAKG